MLQKKGEDKEGLKEKMRRENPVSWLSTKKKREQILIAVVYSLLITGMVIILVPFFWMISTALKEPGKEFMYPIQWIPNPVKWDNFIIGWTKLPFTLWAKNTCIVVGASVVGQVLSAAVVAFGFARLRFPGRRILFLLVLSSMMIPYCILMVPQFLLFKYFKWIDTYKPLVVPYFLGGDAFFIFLLRQLYLTIPFEIDDAARIDGCSTAGVFTRIILPLSKPAVGIMLVFSFMWRWNDFVQPLVFLNSSEKYTLALGLRFFKGQYNVQWTYLMAVSLIVLLPCLIVFFVAQKYYIQGIVITGIKE